MIGVCQHKHLTADRRRAQNLSWQPALPLFEASEFNQPFGNSVFHHNVASFSETEKAKRPG
jgi:hypothetical protein